MMGYNTVKIMTRNDALLKKKRKSKSCPGSRAVDLKQYYQYDVNERGTMPYRYRL